MLPHMHTYIMSFREICRPCKALADLECTRNFGGQGRGGPGCRPASGPPARGPASPVTGSAAPGRPPRGGGGWPGPGRYFFEAPGSHQALSDGGGCSTFGVHWVNNCGVIFRKVCVDPAKNLNMICCAKFDFFYKTCGQKKRYILGGWVTQNFQFPGQKHKTTATAGTILQTTIRVTP